MSVLDDLDAERKKYGATMSDDECVALINAVAWANRDDGWGLNQKTGGTRGRRYDGAEVAHDVLHNNRTDRIYDVLISAGAASRPTWNDLGPNNMPPNQGRPWVAPIAPEGAEPGPVDPPDPPDVDLSAALAMLTAIVHELAALHRLVDALTAELAEATDAARRAESVAKDAANKLDALQPPVYRTRILGQTVTLTPEGR